jgi:hypothetical protein
MAFPATVSSSSIPYYGRNDLKNFKRILIKVGTSVIIHSGRPKELTKLQHPLHHMLTLDSLAPLPLPLSLFYTQSLFPHFTDGSVALSRIGNLVEQIVHLQKAGKEVILVTSGAVGMGTLKLNQQALLSTPLRNHIHGGFGFSHRIDNRAYAAAGLVQRRKLEPFSLHIRTFLPQLSHPHFPLLQSKQSNGTLRDSLHTTSNLCLSNSFNR